MKIILTGKNSYIGGNICTLLNSKGHSAECVSLRKGVNSIDLKGVDAVIHCAAIVHKKEKDYENQYDSVNYTLTANLAHKALKSGVKHFIFMSTMAVYGVSEGEINKSTPLLPKTLYGKSKLKAENYINKLNSDSFKVTVIRPPMVYGKDCPGNYRLLSRLAHITPVIPDTSNKKSLIYIENLACFVSEIVEKGIRGIFMPMDGEYISTSKLMRFISKKPVSKALGRFVMLFPLSSVKKAFGTLYYSEDIVYKADYVDIESAIEKSEGRK